MIHTVANFLEALIDRERKILPEYDDIQHPGIFGSMYEGLTQEVLNRSLFENIDLKVVSGKIQNSKGTLSNQIDCMVVVGAGKPIPWTDQFIYPVKQVIMIVEVKKTLYGAALKESLELFHHFWAEVAEVGAPRTGLVNDAWRALFYKNIPSPSEVDGHPFHEKMIYHTLITESTLPLRVVLGYDGYVDEYGLRKGIIEYIKDICELPLERRPRFNINTFPNLIVCKQTSLIKLDGMPYPGRIDDKGDWVWMASRGVSPFLSLLELLWTRLAYLLKLSPSVFGDDLKMEVMSSLLAAKAIQYEEKEGWEYAYFELSKNDLKVEESLKDWSPPNLT